MRPVVYAVARAPGPPPPLPSLWEPLPQVWEGWDGSRWNLTDPAVSGIALQPGVRGLLTPPFEHQTSRSAGVHGSRWRGYRADERSVFWPVRVFSDASSQAWVEHDARFWRTMHPGRTGVWSVTLPDGEVRSLRCRFKNVLDGALDIDPALTGWALYGIELAAQDPFWSGPPQVRTFSPDDPQDFFPGPPFEISEGSLISSAWIANPGDEPGWAQWWVTDTDEALVGVGDRVVVVPFQVAAERLLVIRTDPEHRTAVEIDAPSPSAPMADQMAWVAERLPSGVDRTRELGAATKFGAVPPSDRAQLSVNVVGSTPRITVVLHPSYHRAW